MKKHIATWVVLALIGYGFAFLFIMSDTGSKADPITPDQIQKLVDDNRHAQYTMMHYKNSRQDHLLITVLDQSGRERFTAPLEKDVTAVLKKNDISAFQSTEGQQFHKWGLFGRSLPLAFIVVMLAGVVTLIRLPKMK